jgi:DNA repair protein RadC
MSYTSGIKGWPQSDRPRERLLKSGERSLSDSELLAILLRTGVKGTSAIDLARKILDKFGTYRNMSHTDIREWKQIKGLGAAKIAQIKAALEIGRRFREDEASKSREKISSAADAAKILMPQLRDLKTEVFKVVYLDNGNGIIEIADAVCGTVDRAMPIVREIIHAALQKFASALICAHNHPSGDPKPSAEDTAFTKELAQAGKTMQIRVLDHIIIGADKYYSFADEHRLIG